jgi:histone deacetylase 1/2
MIFILRIFFMFHVLVKNLLSVNRLVRDNNTFLEFHPNHFVVKEQDTKRILFKGSCEGGLYPLKPPLNKEVLGVFKPTTSTWHHRLGHASQQVVHKILSRQKIPFIRTQNNNEICDACQKGKSHQLPYPKSTSISSRLLSLFFRCLGTDSYLYWLEKLLC